MQKNWQDFFAFMRFLVERFNQDGCAQIAAGLTFATLLSLVPLLTVALTLFSAFPAFEQYSIEIKIFLLNNMVPDMAGKIITEYMPQFTENAMKLTAVGLAMLTVTAMLLLRSIEQGFNTIWRVTRQRPFIKRLVIYWAVLTLAPLLIGASLALTSWLVGLSMGYIRQVPLFGVGVLKLLPLLFTTLAFAMLFRLVPYRHVPRRHALVGALVAAVAFEAMNRAFGYYISHFNSYTLVYGAFASIPVFLMWIYLSWLSILLGALLAASLPYWRVPVSAMRSPAVRLLDTLRILKMMAEGQRSGQVFMLPQFSKALRLDYDTLEDTLERLAQAGMLRRVEGGGWLMVRDAAHIRAAELVHLFVLDRAAIEAAGAGDPLGRWLLSCSDAFEHETDSSLQELFARELA